MNDDDDSQSILDRDQSGGEPDGYREPTPEPDPDQPRGDAELLTAAHAGDRGAYGELWARHLPAARAFAASVGRPADVDELVSEAFTRVLSAIVAGKGPTEAFRPYLLSTIRRVSVDLGRRYYQRVSMTDDDDDFRLPATASAQDDAEVRAENSAALRAWDALPEASKAVLWHLVIEQESLAEIAPILATSPNGVSSRATRAKERLRQTFLQEYVRQPDDPKCTGPRAKLGAYVRQALSRTDNAAVSLHLTTCAACSVAVADLNDMNSLLTRSVAPALVGGPAVLAAYLAAKHSLAGSTPTEPAPSNPKPPSAARRAIGTTRGRLFVAGAVLLIGAGIIAALLGGGGAHHRVDSASAADATSAAPTVVAVVPVVKTVQLQITQTSAQGSVRFKVPTGWAISDLTSPGLTCMTSTNSGTCAIDNPQPGTYTFKVTISGTAPPAGAAMDVTYQAGPVTQQDPI